MTERITITVEENLLELFKKYCRENGMKLSTRLQALMRQDLNKGIS